MSIKTTIIKTTCLKARRFDKFVVINLSKSMNFVVINLSIKARITMPKCGNGNVKKRKINCRKEMRKLKKIYFVYKEKILLIN